MSLYSYATAHGLWIASGTNSKYSPLRASKNTLVCSVLYAFLLILLSIIVGECISDNDIMEV